MTANRRAIGVCEYPQLADTHPFLGSIDRPSKKNRDTSDLLRASRNTATRYRWLPTFHERTNSWPLASSGGARCDAKAARICMAYGGGLGGSAADDPCVGKLEILFQVATAGVLQSQHKLSLLIAGYCRSAKPMEGLSHVFRYPLALLVRDPEIVLSLRTARLRSFLVPMGRLRILAAVVIQVPTDEHLGGCVPSGRRLEPASDCAGRGPLRWSRVGEADAWAAAAAAAAEARSPPERRLVPRLVPEGTSGQTLLGAGIALKSRLSVPLDGGAVVLRHTQAVLVRIPSARSASVILLSGGCSGTTSVHVCSLCGTP